MLTTMKALVTGGTGFVGSNIVLRLLKEGMDVVVTGSDAEVRIPGFTGTMIYSGFAPLDWGQIGNIDALFHQAAINDTTYMNESEMIRHNSEWPAKLFEEAIAHGAKHIVYASSTAVYGDAPAPYKEAETKLNPLNPYAVSKIRLEEHASRLGALHPDVRFVGLRYCNVYGPHESHKGKRSSMIRQLARQMLVGSPRIFTSGDQKRDYIYVQDVVEANMRALTASVNTVVNCGSGSATTFNDLISILNETLGLSRAPEYIPNPYTDRYQNHTECDMWRAREVIGFVPQYDIQKGIAAYHASGFLTNDL